MVTCYIICGFTLHCKQKSNMNSIFRYLGFNRSSTGIVVVGLLSTYLVFIFNTYIRGSHGRDRMVVGFTTTYAISAHHH
jgi:hypothetical protein